MEVNLSLNGVEWATLHTLLHERMELKHKDPEVCWDMNVDEIAIVREWMKRRIQELEDKKE